jgi:hypothetical protein
LGKPHDFDGAYLSEGWDRIQEYALEVQGADGTWKSFFKGTTIGVAGATPAFPRTTGRIVRLHVLKASAGPTIWDFELYEAGPKNREPARSGGRSVGRLGSVHDKREIEVGHAVPLSENSSHPAGHCREGRRGPEPASTLMSRGHRSAWALGMNLAYYWIRRGL